MSRDWITVDERLHDYLVAHGATPDSLLAELIAETRSVLPERAGMQIGPHQTAFMTLLTRMLGVRTAVEIGTFTGMSSLAVARGLAEGGKLICFDVSDEFTSIARHYWELDRVADRIELRIGDAHERLRELPSEPHVDLVFIDADKPGYPDYWNAMVPRVRPGGVILVDNVLWSGRVGDPDNDEDTTRVIDEFNALVSGDERVESVILPIGDGVTVARKR